MHAGTDTRTLAVLVAGAALTWAARTAWHMAQAVRILGRHGRVPSS